MTTFSRPRPARGIAPRSAFIPEYTPAMGMPPQGTLEVDVQHMPDQMTPYELKAGWYCTRANDPIAGPFQTEEDAKAYRAKVGWTPLHP